MNLVHGNPPACAALGQRFERSLYAQRTMVAMQRPEDFSRYVVRNGSLCVFTFLVRYPASWRSKRACSSGLLTRDSFVSTSEPHPDSAHGTEGAQQSSDLIRPAVGRQSVEKAEEDNACQEQRRWEQIGILHDDGLLNNGLGRGGRELRVSGRVRLLHAVMVRGHRQGCSDDPEAPCVAVRLMPRSIGQRGFLAHAPRDQHHTQRSENSGFHGDFSLCSSSYRPARNLLERRAA